MYNCIQKNLTGIGENFKCPIADSAARTDVLYTLCPQYNDFYTQNRFARHMISRHPKCTVYTYMQQRVRKSLHVPLYLALLYVQFKKLKGQILVVEGLIHAQSNFDVTRDRHCGILDFGP